MPRPNRARSLENEENLAKRIAMEREERGMSYEGLARRMSDAGCATHASALYKIEKGSPPRRVTVSELIALAAVFETSIEDLLMPPELRVSQQAREVLHALTAANESLSSGVRHLSGIVEQLRQISNQSPDLARVLSDLYAAKPWLFVEMASISDELSFVVQDFRELTNRQSEVVDQ